MIASSVRSCVPVFRGVVLALLASLALVVHAEPPSDGDVNRLLAASRAQMQREQFSQVAAGRQLTPAQQTQLQQVQERTRQTLTQAMSWSQMRPMYVDLYKRTFTREEVIAMAEFYESPAGQSLLDKTPQLMRNVMGAIQQKMAPLIANLQKDLDRILAEPAPAPAKP
jgi:hypothetical protein